MAEGLTVAGIAVRVVQDSWSEQMVYQGASMRMAAGNLVDTRYAGARVCECQAWFISSAEEATFRAACAIGVPVQVAGELPDTAFTGAVEISQTQKRRIVSSATGDAIVRVATLHIEEAEPA